MHVSLPDNYTRIMFKSCDKTLIKCNCNTAWPSMLNASLYNQNLFQIVDLPSSSGVPGLSGLLKGSFAVTVDWLVRGRDSPCLFTALTRKL